MKKSDLHQIIREEISKVKMNEAGYTVNRYTDEGFVQEMGPEFEQACKMIEKAWYKWKNTYPTNKKLYAKRNLKKLHAKRNLMSYFDMLLD